VAIICQETFIYFIVEIPRLMVNGLNYVPVLNRRGSRTIFQILLFITQ